MPNFERRLRLGTSGLSLNWRKVRFAMIRMTGAE
jgi:hypothetical protein